MFKTTLICIFILCAVSKTHARASCNIALLKEFLNFTKFEYAFDVANGNTCPFGELWVTDRLDALQFKDAHLKKLSEPNLLSFFNFITRARIPCEFNNVHRVLHKTSFNVTFAVSYRHENDEIRVYVIQQSNSRPVSFEILTIPTNVSKVLTSIDEVKSAFDASHARLTTYFTDLKENKTLLMTHQFSKVQNRLKALLVGFDVYPGLISNLQIDLSGKYAFFVINGRVFRVYIDYLAHSIFSSNEVVQFSLEIGSNDDFIPLDPTSILIWRWRNGQREAVVGESSFHRAQRIKSTFHFYELGCAFGGIPDPEGNYRLRLRQHKRFDG
uniref:Secreted protein n=1 Tax=Panagrellus redivivus TaxID=6233 RepID=A0A7E4W5S6_PANRE